MKNVEKERKNEQKYENKHWKIAKFGWTCYQNDLKKKIKNGPKMWRKSLKSIENWYR